MLPVAAQLFAAPGRAVEAGFAAVARLVSKKVVAREMVRARERVALIVMVIQD